MTFKLSTALLCGAALAVLLGVSAPSSRAADVTGCSVSTCGGNWISYLQITGCQCDYGSFNWQTTSYAVDPNGPQGKAGSSTSPITISTGNQTQDVSITIAVNGQNVGASASASGQQYGIYYTSDPITLAPGSNVITITAADPFPGQAPMVYTLTVPFAPTFVTNTVAPTVSGSATIGSTLTCASGTWSSAPSLNAVDVEWQRSTDGSTWTTFAEAFVLPGASTTHTVASADEGSYLRCEVDADNSYESASGISAATALVPVPVPTPAPPTKATPPPTGTSSPTTSGSPTGSTPTSGTTTTGATGSTTIKKTTTRNGIPAITVTLTLAPVNVGRRSLASAISARVGIAITVGPKTVYVLDGKRSNARAVARAITRARKVTFSGVRVGHAFLATQISLR